MNVISTGVFDTIYQKYREKGTRDFLKDSWRRVLYSMPASYLLEPLLGEVLIEKLVMAPRVGYWPQIRQPRSFNEKLMHRKLLTDDPRFATIAGKLSVRPYVASRVGDEVLNQIYYVTDDPETIPFDSLPDEYVIKTGNKGVILVDEEDEIDSEAIKAQCREALAEPFGVGLGEYWYGETDPKIIIEKRLRDEEYDVPLDYKFFVFNGHVEYILVNVDRFTDHTKRIYDRHWNPTDIRRDSPLGPAINPPELLEEMIKVAEEISADFEFMRVDLYQPNGNEIVFGEMTPAPSSGGSRFVPKKCDFEWGALW